MSDAQSADPEVPPLLAPVPPRISGRTELQQRQKQSSRERLVAAARDAFAESSYAATAIDDIVKRADVNRSTFYRHFDSKFAVAKALFDGFWPRLFAEYAAFSPSEPLRDAELADWMERLIAFYHLNQPYFNVITQIGALEPEGVRWEETIRQQVIRLLGRKVPAFSRAVADGAPPELPVRVRMLMINLEMCVYDLAFRGMIDKDASVRVLAEEFRRFVAR